MEAGSSTEELVESSSLTVAGWADTHVAENDDIDRSRHCREAGMSVGGCMDGGSSRGLYPLERAKEGWDNTPGHLCHLQTRVALGAKGTATIDDTSNKRQ